jgi:hypothetical protein
MGELKRINLEDGITVELSLSDEEYRLLSRGRKVLVVPTGDGFLGTELTTGKIGNGNRIMVPNRLLEINDIRRLKKKVPARIFEVNKEKFLLIKLEESSLIPDFK